MTLNLVSTFANTSWDEAPFSEIDGGPKLSHAHVTNNLAGGVAGTAVLDYLMMYVSDIYGTFVGYERIDGTVDGKRGSFCVREDGTFDATSVSATMTIVPDTGTGELTGITGSGSYTAIHGNQDSAVITFEIDLNG